MPANLFIPQGTQRLAERPLSGGIRRDMPPQTIPKGSFYDIKDGYVEPEGIRRRPSVALYADWSVSYPPIQGLWTVRAVSGAAYSILMDQKYIYKITKNALERLDDVYDTGTCSVTGSTVTGSGTAWATLANKLANGDIFVLDLDGSGDGPEEVEIESTTNDTTLVLVSAPTGTYAGGTDYEIRRAVSNSVIAAPVSVNDKLYISEGSRFLRYTDGSTFATLAAYTWMPYVVAYHKDRMWAAHIIDGADNLRPQIRWSNIGVGNFATWDTADFLNLPYGFGRINQLMPMSDFLIAYFTDRLYLGQETSLPDLPVQFRLIETGGIGLTNPFAVAQFFDGHFFVGQDNVYFLSPRGIEAVGNPMVKDTIKRCQVPGQIMACTDYSTSSIMIGFPIDGANDISEIWRYSYKTKQWSRDVKNVSFLLSDTVLETVTWDSLNVALPVNTWAGFGTFYPTWDSIITDEAWNQQVFFGVDTKLYYYLDDAGSLDADTSLAPQLVLETGDKDLGAPDTTKIWTKLSVQLQDALPVGETLSMLVEGSKDKGENWKNLGTLTFAEGFDEESLSFRFNATAARFRFTEVITSSVTPFTVSEIVYYFKLLGGQVASRSDS